MLSNDLNNKIRLRFRNSKDFDILINQLEKEGFKTYIKGYTKRLTNEQQKEEYGFHIAMLVMEIIVMKDNNKLVNVLFENNRDADSEYKQNIIVIKY